MVAAAPPLVFFVARSGQPASSSACPLPAQPPPHPTPHYLHPTLPQVATDPSTKGSSLRLSSLFRRPSPAFGGMADKHVEVGAGGLSGAIGTPG